MPKQLKILKNSFNCLHIDVTAQFQHTHCAALFLTWHFSATQPHHRSTHRNHFWFSVLPLFVFYLFSWSPLTAAVHSNENKFSMHALNVLFCMWVTVRVIRTSTHPNPADQTPAGLFCTLRLLCSILVFPFPRRCRKGDLCFYYLRKWILQCALLR